MTEGDTQNNVEEYKEKHITYLTQKVWQKAISQPQGIRLKEIGKEIILPFAERALDQMVEFEEAAKIPLLERISYEDENINAIWCPSAPGTWNRPWKHDRYDHVPYTQWWDRDQISAAIKISLAIGRMRIGQMTKGKLSSELEKDAMEASPLVVYNGRPDENEALREAIRRGTYKSLFLSEKLHLIDTVKGERYNSLDQVRTFELPERKPVLGDSIGIVIRPGQAIRMLHFLANSNNGFPEGVRVKIFPVKTGTEGIPAHYISETCGLLYYRFTSGDAGETPYPYVF